MLSAPFFLVIFHLLMKGKGTAAKNTLDILLSFFLVISLLQPLSAKNFVNADIVKFAHQLQNFYRWKVITVLPPGNGFVGHTELFSQLFLGKSFFLAKLTQKNTDLFYIHCYTSFRFLCRYCITKGKKCLPHKQRIPRNEKQTAIRLPVYVENLLFDDLQNIHGASLDADAAGDALGSRALGLQNHELHGANFHALAAGDALLLVDHVDAGLGVLGDSFMLTNLHALAALNAGHGLGTVALGNDLDAGIIGVEFLVEGFGAGLNALQASHTFGIFLNNELLHRKITPLFIYFFIYFIYFF